MMDHWYDSMGVGGWLLMSAFWVALIGLVVWAIVNLFPRSGRHGSDLAERPEDILDRRFASGEIDAGTYDALRSKLREAHSGRA